MTAPSERRSGCGSVRPEWWSDEDRRWLGAALAASLLVYVVYLLLYPYPAHGAGLYLAMAEAVREHGYRLPETIPHYTAGGVPFAYPPLLPYLLAALRDATSVDPIALTRYLPGLVVTAYLVPYYCLTRALLGSPRRAGVASLVFAVTPAVLRWHLAAGGVVRAPAFLIVVTGLYAGVRLFGGEDRRWLAPAAVLFGLALLAHPVYAAFFGVSFLVLFAGLDRTPRGLLRGAVVAAGGVALAAPWWTQVVAVHGADVFSAAAGTHSGLGGGVARILDSFVYPLAFHGAWPFFVAAFGGAAYMAATRRYVVPAWVVTAGYLFRQDRLLFVPGAMAAAVLLVDVAHPRARAGVERGSAWVGDDAHRLGATLAVAALLVAAVAGGFAATDADAGERIERTLPAPYMDSQDRTAMAWADRNTPPSATFVVLGDAAEWFPLFADRTILVGPWGVEWKGAAQFERQKVLYESLSACDDAACLTRHLDAAGLRPAYVYVPKGEYTIRRREHTQSREMHRSLVASPQYRVAFENEGVLIVRTVSPADAN